MKGIKFASWPGNSPTDSDRDATTVRWITVAVISRSVVTAISADANGYWRLIVNRGAVVAHDRGAVIAHDRGGVNSLDYDRGRSVIGAAGVAASVAASTESVGVIRGKNESSRDSDACE